MPELPEVEHVVRALRPIVTGRRILAAELNLKRTAPELSRAAFARQLRDAVITGVGRRGKYILFELESGRLLATHLRMTGKFVSLTTDESLPPYAHVVFYLDDERRLVFCDMRQFGRMRLITNAQRLPKELSTLAPEPLSDEFTEEYFLETLSRSRRSLKQLLLDQTRVLGLGNIYAVEALFLAGVNPLKPANRLSKPLRVECAALPSRTASSPSRACAMAPPRPARCASCRLRLPRNGRASRTLSTTATRARRRAARSLTPARR